MCGEIDEQVLIGQEMADRVKALTKKLALPEAGTSGTAPENLAEAEGRIAYMEALFSDTLSRAFADIARAEEEESIDAIAAQAIALARVAGFLAGQLPPEADLYRAVIESATAGSAEARDTTHALQHENGHHHH